jgi:TPR repeat protein
MYASGSGVAQDHALAVESWRRAAAQGNASAQFNLGLSYRDGRGVQRDFSQALAWLMVASERMTGADQQRCADSRDALAKKSTPAQVAEAEKLAREWAKAFESQKP